MSGVNSESSDSSNASDVAQEGIEAAVDASHFLTDTSAATSSHVPNSGGTEAGDLEIDEGLMYAYDAHPLVASRLKSEPTYLLDRATSSTQALVASLFSLPTKRVDRTVVCQLPPPRMRLPRAKQLPVARPETKWEQFARIKGIKKTKKTFFKWDEDYGEYRPRTGRHKANDDQDQWLIEDNKGQGIVDPEYDPFVELEKKKKDRIAKQKKNQRRNEASAARTAVKSGVNKLLPTAVGATVGLDVPGRAPRDLRKEDLKRTLPHLQVSTASMGKFDEKLKGEKKLSGQKRKFDSLIQNAKDEAVRNLKVLQRLESRDDGPALDIDRAVRAHNLASMSKQQRKKAARTERRSKQGFRKKKRT